MRPIPAISTFLALLVLTASPAAAQGTSLRWTSCLADAGTRNMAFACDTNDGTVTLVTSFVLPAPVPGARSVTGIIDVYAADATLPAWWDLKVCRSGSIAVSQPVTGTANCELAEGFSGGSVSSYVLGVNGPNTARMQYAATGTAHDLATGREYIGPILRMNFNRTVGDFSCGGCGTGVCLVLSQVTIGTSFGGPELQLLQPDVPPDGNIATWQGVGFTPGGACVAATPTKRVLWGAVKALYR